jgi:adenylate cyclase class IV
MRVINVEIKARTERRQEIREILEKMGARFSGKDRQKDVYFRSRSGRLKLREDHLLQQCRSLMNDFGIQEEELEPASYSDLLLKGR